MKYIKFKMQKIKLAKVYFSSKNAFKYFYKFTITILKHIFGNVEMVGDFRILYELIQFLINIQQKNPKNKT